MSQRTERVDELLDLKRTIYRWYSERLADRSDLKLYSSANVGVVWWMVSVLVDPTTGWDKDTLQDALSMSGIDTRPVFRPLSSLPAYSAEAQALVARERNSVAYRVSPYALNLPTALSLTEGDVDRVCAALIALLER